MEGSEVGEPVCLSDLNMFPQEELNELEAMAYRAEHTLLDLLIWEEGSMSSYLRLYSRHDCVAAVELRVRGCGDGLSKALSLADWPEVSRVVIEGECAEAVINPYPPARIRGALNKLNVEPRILAYRPVKEEGR